MKYLILLVALLLPVNSFADACFIVVKTTNNDLPPNEVNQLTDVELRDYEARIQPWDISSVYEAWQCGTSNNPDSPTLAVVVTGLDIELARQYLEVWQDFTGELDENNNPVPYIKKMQKFSLAHGNLPTPLKNQLLGTDYVEVEWATIRNYVENKVTGNVGE